MPEIHASAERLYAAADKLRDVRGQSAVARLLKVSPQVMKNWEARGVSEKGALLAQAEMRCDANWILGGQGAMVKDFTEIQHNGTQHVVAEPRPHRSARQGDFSKRFTIDEWAKLPEAVRATLEDSIEAAVIRHVRGKPETAAA